MNNTKNSRLGVNIDHVATLRQARGEHYPSLVEAARVCLEAGADQITIHLREDRRHIQDTDVGSIKLVTDRYGKPLNLEMGCNEDIVNVAIDVKPQWICLVPEKREEKTTEGGLDLIDNQNFNRVAKTVALLKEKIPQTKISLFIEADRQTIEKAISLKIDAVEIHTGDYAREHLNGESVEGFIKKYLELKHMLIDKKIGYHAGHGLTGSSLIPLIKHNIFEEYNIGHWIVCDSVFYGLANVVSNLSRLMKNI